MFYPDSKSYSVHSQLTRSYCLSPLYLQYKMSHNLVFKQGLEWVTLRGRQQYIYEDKCGNVGTTELPELSYY